MLVAVGFGGGFGFSGQRVIVEGQAFVNTLAAYDSFNPGRFFSDTALQPYSLSLESLDAVYETQNRDAIGQPIDFTAHVTVEGQGEDASEATVKVNEPLYTHGTDVYLLGNGYAPTITVRERRWRRRVHRLGAVPPAGREPHVDRRRQGARRHARAARHGRLLLPDAGAARLGRRTRRTTPT